MAAHVDGRLPSATRQPGAAVLVALAVACVLIDSMGVAVLFDIDFLRFGYRRAGDLGIAGWEISGVPKLLLLISFVAWGLWLVLLIYRVAARRKPSLRRACRWGAGLSLLAVLCAPGWVDLQITHYSGPGRSTELAVGNRWLPLVAWVSKSDIEMAPSDSPVAGREFWCPESRRLKMLGLELRTSFYPSLDAEHALTMMASRCRLLPGEGQ